MEDDICGICLESLPNLHENTSLRNRLMCCGKELCTICYEKLLKKMYMFIL